MQPNENLEDPDCVRCKVRAHVARLILFDTVSRHGGGAGSKSQRTTVDAQHLLVSVAPNYGSEKQWPRCVDGVGR